MRDPDSPALSLELYCQAVPAVEVPENSEIEIRLVNSGPHTLEDLSLRAGPVLLRDRLRLPPGGWLALPYNPRDLAGDHEFRLQDRTGLTLAQAALGVTPLKISRAGLGWLLVERLPGLLARLDAPNRFRLSAGPLEPEQPLFELVSADYSALRLRQAADELLDGGLLAALGANLDYLTPDRLRYEAGFIRGNVQWSATLKEWAARPQDQGLAHRWTDAPREYDTPANRLLLYFAADLAGQLRQLAGFVRRGLPASPALLNRLPELEKLATELENSPELQTGRLQPVRSGQAGPDFDPRRPDLAALLENDLARAAERNPHYARLRDLWQLYNRRYLRLPDAPEAADIEMGVVPLGRLYELWAACEVAAGLGLIYDGPPGLESARFEGAGLTLYYNQAAPGGWYSRSRPVSPRPDLRLVRPDGSQIFLDVKYRAEEGGAGALLEDVYRMLAYMNDFGIGTGAIIYPGRAGLPDLRLTGAGGRRMGELALQPPGPDSLAEWEAGLKECLARLTGI